MIKMIGNITAVRQSRLHPYRIVIVPYKIHYKLSADDVRKGQYDILMPADVVTRSGYKVLRDRVYSVRDAGKLVVRRVYCNEYIPERFIGTVRRMNYEWHKGDEHLIIFLYESVANISVQDSINEIKKCIERFRSRVEGVGSKE